MSYMEESLRKVPGTVQYQHEQDRQQAERIAKYATFIANGEAFHVKPDSLYNGVPSPDTSGFGGREFFIKSNDGELIHTQNLWHMGSVPDGFRDKLRDNAAFISREEYAHDKHVKARQISVGSIEPEQGFGYGF